MFGEAVMEVDPEHSSNKYMILKTRACLRAWRNSTCDGGLSCGAPFVFVLHACLVEFCQQDVILFVSIKCSYTFIVTLWQDSLISSILLSSVSLAVPMLTIGTTSCDSDSQGSRMSD